MAIPKAAEAGYYIEGGRVVKKSSKQTGPPTEFYHGTSLEAALTIQEKGFDVDLSGSNAGAMLGPGVYITTSLQMFNLLPMKVSFLAPEAWIFA